MMFLSICVISFYLSGFLSQDPSWGLETLLHLFLFESIISLRLSLIILPLGNTISDQVVVFPVESTVITAVEHEGTQTKSIVKVWLHRDWCCKTLNTRSIVTQLHFRVLIQRSGDYLGLSALPRDKSTCLATSRLQDDYPKSHRATVLHHYRQSLLRILKNDVQNKRNL